MSRSLHKHIGPDNWNFLPEHFEELLLRSELQGTVWLKYLHRAFQFGEHTKSCMLTLHSKPIFWKCLVGLLETRLSISRGKCTLSPEIGLVWRLYSRSAIIVMAYMMDQPMTYGFSKLLQESKHKVMCVVFILVCMLKVSTLLSTLRQLSLEGFNPAELSRWWSATLTQSKTEHHTMMDRSQDAWKITRFCLLDRSGSVPYFGDNVIINMLGDVCLRTEQVKAHQTPWLTCIRHQTSGSDIVTWLAWPVLTLILTNTTYTHKNHEAWTPFISRNSNFVTM